MDSVDLKIFNSMNFCFASSLVEIMAETCVEAELAQNTKTLYQAVRNSTLEKLHHLSVSESIASSAVKTSVDIGAKAIIVCSESGSTAAQIAKFRPALPTTVLTTCPKVARQCYGVLRGCDSILLSSFEHTDRTLNATIDSYKKSGFLKAGDPILVVSGTISRAGATNVMRIQYA